MLNKKAKFCKRCLLKYYCHISNESGVRFINIPGTLEIPNILFKDVALQFTDIPSTRSDGESDSSLIPKSCCDVSGIISECPDNYVPSHSKCCSFVTD